MAISNSFFINLKGAEVDAERFLAHAVTWAESGTIGLVIDAEFFIQFLGTFVYLFDLNEFGLTVIGIFVFYTAYFFMLYKFGAGSRGGALFVILITLMCLFSPSVMLRIGALLREPYVVFSITFVVYFGVQFLRQKKVRFLLYSIAFMLCGLFFHKAVLAFAPVYLVIILFFAMNVSIKSFIYSGLFLSLTFMLISQALPSFVDLRGGEALGVLMSGDFSDAERIVGYKSGREFRTTYDYGADFGSLGGIIITAIKANLYYYFAPFPWQIRTAIDVFSFLENTIRFFVIMYVLRYVFSGYKLISGDRKVLLFIMVCYFLLNTIWSIGTSNYGTGSRHHITTMPLLFMSILYINRYSFNKINILSSSDVKKL